MSGSTSSRIVSRRDNGPVRTLAVLFLIPAVMVAFLAGCAGPTNSSTSGSPEITLQPVSQTVPAGQPATFTVSAASNSPLTYQWLKNGSNIAGAASSSYTTPPTTTADSGSTFQVIVSNSIRSTVSAMATLTVDGLPSITTQPANQTVNVGQMATFTVVATGAPPLSYQWQKNQVNIAGATSASYTTPATTSADNGTSFRVIVTNPVTSVTSNAATLTVNTGPSITTQPASQTVNVGQTATFTVMATGAPPLSYQWQKNQVNIAGATSASYTTPATTSADSGTSFRVIVTNPVTSVTSNAATLTVNAGPSITTQPASQTVNVGQMATFTVVATGAPPLSYQWQKNQVNIAGATSASYTTPATTSADNGTSFRVIVTNPVTSVTSNAATLTVNTGPSITTQPASQTVNVGQTATFTVVATGAPPLSYQWQKNQVNIAGATSASYTTPATTSADNGTSFRVIVTNPVTSVTSNAATLTVNTGPSITTQPASQTVNVGQTATFTVMATGAPPLSYQWQKNQVNIAGATSASYTTPATTSADSGTSFRVIVTNPVTSVTSNAATLTVNPAPPTVMVLTQHNDIARTGQNTSETILNTTNVNANQFGKLFGMTVDGQVYAQPLYVPGVTINGGIHNVVIIATEADSVYAYDADSSAAPLWKASLVDAAHGAGTNEAPLNSATTIGCSDLQPLIGITATPVIDAASNTIYVEAKSTNGTNYFHRLHSLDLLTGNEKSPGPIHITATVAGTGDGSTNGQLIFDSDTMSLHAQARPGLLLINGTIYIAFASHCDFGPYHGWLFAYDETTLVQKSVYVTTPNEGLGGFWMSGAGVAADSNGNIYIPSGNGDFDTTNVPARETGDTMLKFGSTNQILMLLDYFTPEDQQSLNDNDTDLGSGGTLLLPDQPGSFPHILVQAGKEGIVYVLNRDQLTTGNLHYCSGCTSDTEILEESAAVGGMWSMPAYWNNNLYFWGSADVLKSIPIVNGLPDFTHIAGNSNALGFPGPTPSVSSNGTTAGTAIIWAIDSTQYGSPGPGPGPAVLYAYDATNIASLLYNSAQAANNRDTAGNAVKFAVPTIANGKVYIGTSTEVDVYGLLPP